MPKELVRRSPHRVAAVSVAVIAVIAAAVSVTIWRYEAAISRSDVAIDALGDARLTNSLIASFWHEREAMNEYLFAPSPMVFREIGTVRAQFSAQAATLAFPSRRLSHGCDRER